MLGVWFCVDAVGVRECSGAAVQQSHLAGAALRLCVLGISIAHSSVLVMTSQTSQMLSLCVTC